MTVLQESLVAGALLFYFVVGMFIFISSVEDPAEIKSEPVISAVLWPLLFGISVVKGRYNGLYGNIKKVIK